MKIREANKNDWESLLKFFLQVYREDHPLHSREFWEWQYGDKQYGRSFICINEQAEIVGHVGANFQGGLAWIINVYLDENYRGQGILGNLYNLARSYYPLAATAANKAGLGLYRNMGWIRYYDLQRYVVINPNIAEKSLKNVCRPVDVSIKNLLLKDSHYFRQPNIKGILLEDGSRALSQENVGGLRVLSIDNLKSLEEQAWKLGYLWMDYITSWNDLMIKQLELANWSLDYNSVVPWHLNPLVEGYYCDITFLSEIALPNDLVVARNFSDHGRIGSLK